MRRTFLTDDEIAVFPSPQKDKKAGIPTITGNWPPSLNVNACATSCYQYIEKPIKALFLYLWYPYKYFSKNFFLNENGTKSPWLFNKNSLFVQVVGSVMFQRTMRNMKWLWLHLYLEITSNLLIMYVFIIELTIICL